MAKTLEEIKGMNLKKGDRIEMELKVDLPESKKFKAIGYFVKVFETMKDPQLVYNVATGHVFNSDYPVAGGEVYLSMIENITVLEPRNANSGYDNLYDLL